MPVLFKDIVIGDNLSKLFSCLNKSGARELTRFLLDNMEAIRYKFLYMQLGLDLISPGHS
jgi:hypothetical protein